MSILELPTPHDVNWNLVIPIAVSTCGSLLVLIAVWDRIRKVFAAKVDFDYLKAEVHDLRVRVATLEKTDGKLDQILASLERKRRSHE